MEETQTGYTHYLRKMNYFTYLVVHCLLAVFSVLPLPMASAIGGAVGQFIGPFTKRHKVALKNLALVYPDKPAQWHRRTASRMWNHLGRVFAEMPALKSGELLARLTTIHGSEHLKATEQGIYVSAHLGQWELCVPAARANGVQRTASLYRHINNHRIDELLKSYRSQAHDELIRKKGDNAIALVRALKEGKSLMILTDQRLTKGDVMPFLGIEAPTNTAPMKLAIKAGIPIIVSSVVREQGVDFTGTAFTPIYPPEVGSDEEKAAVMSRQVFDLIEQQIHAHPEQYLWLHNRWK